MHAEKLGKDERFECNFLFFSQSSCLMERPRNVGFYRIF